MKIDTSDPKRRSFSLLLSCSPLALLHVSALCVDVFACARANEPIQLPEGKIFPFRVERKTGISR